ncbi:hypothetical protein I2W78_14290 [Streptomyces spinoverrucosus]|uniref:hypothetical protein n=1 Tax=Streptomyces spinoverrucosus TaxID=284043 RepID=UPI0018C36019|nr:hypothetical protein [Streptomyces spinoverrucosus]MBG0852984.1 hypothetical protein [Streptomyces spinoverrucosus]
MLARLPLGYLLLMAALAVVVGGVAVQRCMRMSKVTTAFLAVSVGCCLVMTAVGALSLGRWNERQMLVVYAFTWTGLMLGLFPSRKLLAAYAEDVRRGVTGNRFVYPVRNQVAFYASVLVMALLGAALAI